ncbi:MAG: ferrous iron transport protein B [Planctomycetota bacterium]|nr:ferrous iron transport protein B [Planctomycetota bacterium]
MIQQTHTRLVALAGNPNTGKTTLFNRLTGSRAKVGNYPGVTVERHIGRLDLPEIGRVELMDVPGTYSLAARSGEEQLALRAVAGLHPLERPDALVCVVDATQLSRNLYLVLQLIELDMPLVVALNMTDLVEESGQTIDAERLAGELGVPVVPCVAVKGKGLAEVREAIAQVLADPSVGRPGWRWSPSDPELLADMEHVGAALPEDWHDRDKERRHALALWALLSIDDEDELEGVPSSLRDVVRERRAKADEAGREIDEEIIRGRYGWIDARAHDFLAEEKLQKHSMTDRIDRVLLHPALGFAIFLGLMTVIFQSLFTWADPAIRLIENTFAAIGSGVDSVLPDNLLTDLLVNGVITGVGSIIIFLPQILLLFFFIGLMEDTGYIARVAYLMDRIMKSIGLHGRAFVPMMSGFACAVPAIMATRTMERKRDRLLTMMVIPLMTCSARLPIYGLLIAALYPPDIEKPFAQGLLMAAMYLFSTVIALVCAAVLGRTMFRGPNVPLILEMPPYRMPHWMSVLKMMWQRSMVFVREAGTVILTCTVILWVLLTFPREPQLDTDYEALRVEAADSLQDEALDERLAAIDGEQSGARLRASYGGRLGRAIEPAIEPLGFDWKIGVGIIGAFAAREVFVSTMAVVYGLEKGEDETSQALRDRIRAQRRPDGTKTYTPLVCFSLMVFFALACQCMSTLAVTKRETGTWRWPVFMFVYMTALAWVASFVVYQGGRLIGFE